MFTRAVELASNSGKPKVSRGNIRAAQHPSIINRGFVKSGYFRGKIAQEKLIEESSIPYSIVHATQFFEFLKGLADISVVGGEVHLPHVLFQPMSADDVASGVGCGRRARKRHRRNCRAGIVSPG